MDGLARSVATLKAQLYSSLVARAVVAELHASVESMVSIYIH